MCFGRGKIHNYNILSQLLCPVSKLGLTTNCLTSFIRRLDLETKDQASEFHALKQPNFTIVIYCSYPL